MLIQLKPQHFTIGLIALTRPSVNKLTWHSLTRNFLELELELLAVEVRIVFVDDAMIVLASLR